MNTQDFINQLNTGEPVFAGTETYKFMHGVSQDALKITMEMNNKYHTPEELLELFSQLIGKQVDPTFVFSLHSILTVVKTLLLERGFSSTLAVDSRTKVV